jgi:RES domain-containing protein
MMAAPALFDKSRDVDDDAYRNIVSLRESEDLFSDLSDGDGQLSAVAAAAEIRVKSAIPAGVIQRGFHYTTSITYPFEHEPYLRTRYGNGSFGIWYGALALETTIHETAFHMVKAEAGIEDNHGPIIRERAVYLVHCRALLIDLTGKARAFPGLLADDYGLTHQIGERLHQEGHPGLLAPSVRHAGGTTLVALTPAVLSNPRPFCYLTYSCDPVQRTVTVERQPGEILTSLTF